MRCGWLLRNPSKSENKSYVAKPFLKSVSYLVVDFSQWNTYGDPPNSDLLRRYGHVDILPLPDGGEGNPADVVEVCADIVVDVVTQYSNLPTELSKERINWWLEQGGDEQVIPLPDFTSELTVKVCTVDL